LMLRCHTTKPDDKTRKGIFFCILCRQKFPLTQLCSQRRLPNGCEPALERQLGCTPAGMRKSRERIHRGGAPAGRGSSREGRHQGGAHPWNGNTREGHNSERRQCAGMPEGGAQAVTDANGDHRGRAPPKRGATTDQQHKGGAPPVRGATGEGCQQEGAPPTKGADADHRGGAPQGRGTPREGQHQRGAPPARGARREGHCQREAPTGNGTSGAGHKHGWVPAGKGASGEGVCTEERQHGGCGKGGVAAERGDRRRRGGKRRGESVKRRQPEAAPGGRNTGGSQHGRRGAPAGTETGGDEDRWARRPTWTVAAAGIGRHVVSRNSHPFGWAPVLSSLLSVNIDTTNGRTRSQSGGLFVHRRARGVTHHWVCGARRNCARGEKHCGAGLNSVGGARSRGVRGALRGARVCFAPCGAG